MHCACARALLSNVDGGSRRHRPTPCDSDVLAVLSLRRYSDPVQGLESERSVLCMFVRFHQLWEGCGRKNRCVGAPE